MPFVSPTMSYDYGDRIGTTLLVGSLAPVTVGGVIATLRADIAALPPDGLIHTVVAAGFEITPPPGASMLVVTVSGEAWSRSLVEALGPVYAHAHAELSITIEDWVHRSPAVLGAPRMVSKTTFNPTIIYEVWAAAILPFQAPIFDDSPFTTLAGMPITPLGIREYHSFICWINLIQQADAFSTTFGYAAAVSNVAFSFDSVFVAFS